MIISSLILMISLIPTILFCSWQSVFPFLPHSHASQPHHLIFPLGPGWLRSRSDHLSIRVSRDDRPEDLPRHPDRQQSFAFTHVCNLHHHMRIILISTTGIWMPRKMSFAFTNIDIDITNLIFQLGLDRPGVWLQTSAVHQDSSFRWFSDDQLDHR